MNDSGLGCLRSARRRRRRRHSYFTRTDFCKYRSRKCCVVVVAATASYDECTQTQIAFRCARFRVCMRVSSRRQVPARATPRRQRRRCTCTCTCICIQAALKSDNADSEKKHNISCTQSVFVIFASPDASPSQDKSFQLHFCVLIIGATQRRVSACCFIVFSLGCCCCWFGCRMKILCDNIIYVRSERRKCACVRLCMHVCLQMAGIRVQLALRRFSDCTEIAEKVPDKCYSHTHTNSHTIFALSPYKIDTPRLAYPSG